MKPAVLYSAIGIGSVAVIGAAYIFLNSETSSGAKYEFTTEKLAPTQSGPKGSVGDSESNMTGGKKSRRKKPSKKYSKRVWH
jgi:hypothetical protein